MREKRQIQFRSLYMSRKEEAFSNATQVLSYNEIRAID
jgi:hypothetical protein